MDKIFIYIRNAKFNVFTAVFGPLFCTFLNHTHNQEIRKRERERDRFRPCNVRKSCRIIISLRSLASSSSAVLSCLRAGNNNVSNSEQTRVDIPLSYQLSFSSIVDLCILGFMTLLYCIQFVTFEYCIFSSRSSLELFTFSYTCL